MRRLIALIAVLFLVSAGISGVPAKMYFQGKFTDDFGVPIDGEYDVIFKVWDSPIAGVMLWTESRSINFYTGLFSEELGSTVALPESIFTGAVLYLEMTVNGEILTPRKPLITVPYAFRAAIADSVVGGSVNYDTLVTFIEAYLDTAWGDSISHIDSIHYIDSVSFVDSITYIYNITHIDSIHSIDSVTYISYIGFIDSVHYIDSIAHIDSVTHIDSISYVSYVSFIDSIARIDSVRWIDSISYVDFISFIDSIGYIDSIGWVGHTAYADSAGRLVNALTPGAGITGEPFDGSVARTWTVAGGSADGWGDDTVHSDATLDGQGTATSPLKIARQSAATGQVLKWDGLSWSPAADDTGSGGAADADWQVAGDDMYSLPTGNVGIGTTLPAEKLDIAGTAQMTGFSMPTGATAGYVLTSDASGVGTWQEATGSGTDDDWTRAGNIVHTYNATDTIGIGTTSPTGGRLVVMDNSEGTGVHLLAEPPTADNTVRNSPRLDFTDTYRWIGSPGSHTSSIYTSSPCPGCNRYLNFDNGLTKYTMNSSAVEFEFKGDFQNWPNLDMVFVAPAVTSDYADGTDIVLDMRGQYWNGSSSAIRSAKITHEVEDDGTSSLNFKIQGDTNRMTVLSGGNIGIGTTAPAEKLDIAGTARMTGFSMPTGATDGYVLTSDASGVGTWQEATGSSGDAWLLTGNAGTLAGTNFLGTTDDQGLDFRTNNILRMRLTTKGQLELFNATSSTSTSTNMILIGQGAGENQTYGTGTVFIGHEAGYNSESAAYTVGVGYQALHYNTTGDNNTAVGYQAMLGNSGSSSGIHNTALGYGALRVNPNKSYNTAIGSGAMFNNANGENNVAVGYNALLNNCGDYNTAVGWEALDATTTSATFNTALGKSALGANTAGTYNTAVGANALIYNETGTYNTAVGNMAGPASGSTGLTNTICIGNGAQTDVSNRIVLGNSAVTSLRIGEGALATSASSANLYYDNATGLVYRSTASAGADDDWAYSSGSGLTGEIYHTGDVGIGTATPDASAKLEVASTTQGFLPPRMTEAQRDAIPSPANALIIFNTTTDCLQIYNHSAWNSIWCYSCAPSILMHPSDLSICEGVAASFYITAEGADLVYRWQENTGTGWINIPTGGIYSGVTSATLTISPTSLAMDGYQYRCIVSGSCSPEATSATATLSVYVASIAATSVTADEDLLCTGESTTLRVVGGSLGDGAAWKWYSGSCGGTYVGTGDTLLVTPVATTTYYVRAEGTCNTTVCRSKAVTVTSSMPIGVQYYTTPGTYTFTVPADITSISVAAVGGGGGGCGHRGGMGGDPDAVPGEAGGNSSFGSYITAYGGAGGGRQYDPAAVGGGYSGPNGYSGGNGGTLYGGGGGGAATFTGNGGNGGIGVASSGDDGGNGGNSGGAGRTGSYGIGGSGGGIYLTGTPNTGEAGQYSVGGKYGGGGGGSSVYAGGGGGGAGGGIVWQNYIAVTPGENITVTVGDGGDSGAEYAADGQCGAVRIIWEYPCSPEANYPNNAD